MAEPELHYGKYRIRWKDEKGKRCSQVFETRKIAKEELRKRIFEVQQVEAGLLRKDNHTITFGMLADYWLEHRAAYKRSKKDDVSAINKYLNPAFQNKPIASIRTAEIDSFKKQLEHLTPKSQSNYLTLLITMLKLAVELEWLVKIPVIKKPSTKLFSKEYHFLQTTDEINRFLNAAKVEGGMVHLLYCTAVFTGMRQGELAGLRFSDIDLERNLITVQRSYYGPTKSDKVRYVPIMANLKPLLVAWRDLSQSEYVFINQSEKMHSAGARVFKQVFFRVLKRAGFSKHKDGGKRKNYICFHDLRHTFASHWMMNGGDLFKLQRILGHQDSKMTQRYAHLSPSAFKDDIDRLGGLL